MFGIKVVEKPPSGEKILKNVRFGTARGLTKTAQEGQTAVEGAIKGQFTIRGSWFRRSSPFGIKIKPAKPNDLSAEVRTRADWLEKQRKGGLFFPFGNFFAIPTQNVRRTKTQMIGKAQRPSNLKNAFVLKSKKSGVSVLFQRKGRRGNKSLVAMYILVPKVRVTAVDTFYEPVKKVVQRRLQKNVNEGVANAFKTMK
jgi:hypothetical protein